MLDDLFSSITNEVTIKKEVVLKGITFKMRVLSFDEDQKISSYPEDGENPVAFYYRMKIKVLSYAIESINGEVIPEIIEVPEGDKTITKERSLYLVDKLSKLPTKITDSLFDIYIDFKEEQEKNISEDIKYEWFKTPEQREKDRKKKAEEKDNPETPETSEESKVTENSEESKVPEESEESEEKEEIVLKKVDIQE